MATKKKIEAAEKKLADCKEKEAAAKLTAEQKPTRKNIAAADKAAHDTLKAQIALDKLTGTTTADQEPEQERATALQANYAQHVSDEAQQARQAAYATHQKQLREGIK